MNLLIIKNIYRESLLGSTLKRLSFLPEGSFFAGSKKCLGKKKYLFPEILRGSKVIRILSSFFAKRKIGLEIEGTEKIASYVFFLIFLFFPLKSWLKGTFDLGSLYAFFVPVALVLVAALFLISRQRKWENLHFSLVDLSIVCVVLSIIVSNIESYMVYSQGLNLIYESFIWLSYIAIFYLGRIIIHNRSHLLLFLRLNLFMVFVLSVIGIGQYVLGVATPGWIESFEVIRTRIYSTLDNPIILSGYINIFLFLGLALFFATKSVKARAAFLIQLAVMALALVLTFSRSGWVAFALGLIFFFLVYNARYLASLFTFATFAILLAPGELFYRFLGVFGNQYQGISAVSGRIWSIHNVFHILPQHILYGVGLGMYGGEVAYKINPSLVYMEGIQGGVVPIQNTDNQFLQILLQQGVVGLFAFVFFTISAIYTGLIIYKKLADKTLKMVALGITTALFCFFVQGIFADVLQFPQLSLPAFALLGILLSLPRLEGVKRRSSAIVQKHLVDFA